MDPKYMTTREILALFAPEHEFVHHSLLGVESMPNKGGIIITCSCGTKLHIAAADPDYSPAIVERLRLMGKFEILKHPERKGK